MAMMLLAALGRAANDDQRIAQVRDEIATIEAMVAANANAPDRPRLALRLQTLQEELAILEKRLSIEARERAIQSKLLTNPSELLREKLRAIPADPAAVEARVREISARQTRATAERDSLRRQLAQAGSGTDAATATKRAGLEEHLYTKNEELRALALQQEAAEYEVDLVRQAQGLRDRLHAAETSAHLSIGTLFGQNLLGRRASLIEQLGARIANIDENIRNSEAAVVLARQKLTMFDEQLQLLERQTNFLRRNPRAEAMIATERAQKQQLGDRLPFLTDQVDALNRSRELLLARQELLKIEEQFLDEQLASLRAAYVARLRWPASMAALLIVAYLALSRTVLARRYKKEELFLSRRIGIYVTALLVILVFAFHLIDDLSVLATTLGLVSAAIVFSLQDVCASFFGWFVIMFGRKFTIGDRLEIDGTRGDVLDVQLLRTTMLEINNWLGADQPTGRVLVIPNNLIFKSKVFNYSHGHPYIWGKVEVTVTYDTPVAGAMALFRKVLEEETRQDFAEARQAAKSMVRRYGVEDAEYVPKIHTRIADSGVTFSLFYVSHYRGSSTVRNRINNRLIAELETHPHVKLAYNTLQVIASAAAPEGGPSAVLGRDTTQAPFMAKAGT